MVAVLMTPPYLEFVDENGIPYAGGFVYTYAAGTTTPKATYTDYTGGTSASNPIVLDAAGRATIWIDGSYKFIVKDSAGVTVSTTDNVTSFTALTTAGIAYLASPAFTGTPTAPTAAAGTNTTQLATTAFIATALTPLSTQSTTVDVTNGTTETAIYTFNVPANTLGTTGVLSCSLTGDYLNNTGAGSTLTINIKYGATTIGNYVLGSQAQNASRRDLMVDCILAAQNSTGSQCARSRVTIGAAATVAGVAAAASVALEAVHNAIAEDSTAIKTFQITVTHGTISASISCRSLNAILKKL